MDWKDEVEKKNEVIGVHVNFWSFKKKSSLKSPMGLESGNQKLC